MERSEKWEASLVGSILAIESATEEGTKKRLRRRKSCIWVWVWAGIELGSI